MPTKVINRSVAQRLNDFCKEAEDINSGVGLDRWSSKLESFLNTVLGPGEANAFLSLKHNNEWQQHALRLGHIQGLIALSEASDVKADSSSHQTGIPPGSAPSRRVFVVHGHDNEAKETAARFLEKIGMKPVILHEQPNSGRTLIEKFETYSGDIAFAVVLLTPDDVGSAKAESHSLRPRARQNVILELGYFMGRLGRVGVCALYKGGIELPSDYQGVVYIEMDSPGAWKAKLAQELIEAKVSIDLSGLVS